MKQGLTVDEARKQAFLSVKDVSELLNMGTTYVYAHIKSPDCAFYEYSCIFAFEY